MSNQPPVFLQKSEMRSTKNYLLHGLFFTLYAPIKYCSVPLVNYLRYLIIKIFCKRIQSSGIGEGVTIWFPWNVEIGEDSTLNQGVIIDGTAGVRIGNNVRIAPSVILNTADHEFRNASVLIRNQGFQIAPIEIEDDVWIGAGVIVNKGVTIGKGSVIGAGSVVTRNIPPYSIAVGVPCKVIKTRESD
jgi:acetyltransferase-like isoleucine patch superfamily enzyme